MALSRRAVLAGLFGGVTVLAAVILTNVLGTVFFAITIAYVLVPFHDVLQRRGIPNWWASAAATLTAFLGVVVIAAPIGFVVYRRRRPLLDVLETLPEVITVEYAGFAYSVTTGEVIGAVGRALTQGAIGFARASPVIAAKATVFAFVVFALLLRREHVRHAVLGPVPDEYHNDVLVIHDRVRETLYGLYVIQAATAAGTFVIAVGVFFALGYQFPIALALVAAFLQFVPVVGPSLLVLALGAFAVVMGSIEQAVLVVVLGLVLIAALPDVLIRPRLARETADLPSSLYFVGFVGGVLSLGAIGIIAGPLVIAVFVEVLKLLAAEMDQTRLEDYQS